MKKGEINFGTVLIVGGSSSIGEVILEQFYRTSECLITTYTSTPTFNLNEQIHSLSLDLRDDCSIEVFSQKLKALTPKIHIAIFLSGILPGKSLSAYEFVQIDEVMDVNFIGQAKLLLRIFPLLTSQTRIFMLSSISAQRGSFDPIYAASKGAILSLVKSLASALPPGARINAIAPGLIQDSAMFYAMPQKRQAHHKKQATSKQLLQQLDLAKIIFDLCQDHWGYLNGACIDINGGQYVR